MTDKVLSAIERHNMLAKGATVIVALSGGADSMTLFSFLISIKPQYNLNLIAAHVNHGLRGAESNRDEQFVRNYCETLGVPLKVLHADIEKLAKESGEGLEECGRRIRYEFFEKIDQNALIATAHTLSDSIETMLINLARGTALKGLCGIPAKRGRIIRPLIDCTRAEIEEYCHYNRIPYVTDSTNLSNDYTRNKVRNEIIPLLYQLNPSLDKAFHRCISFLEEDETLLSTMAEQTISRAATKTGYNVKELLDSPKSVRGRALQKIIFEHSGAMPLSKHIAMVEDLLTSKGTVQISTKTFIRVQNGILNFPSAIETIAPWAEPLTVGKIQIPFGFAEISIVYKKDFEYTQKFNKEMLANCFDYDKIGENTLLRCRQSGDNYTQNGRNVTKTLKKLFNEDHIPLEKRNQIAVISDDTGVVWVEGYGADERCKITQDTQRIMCINIRRQESD